MKPDSMLVEERHLLRAIRKLGRVRHEAAFEELLQQEPLLAGYIQDRVTNLVGDLALRDLDPATLRQFSNRMLEVCLVSFAAVRAGHYDLWKDANLGRRGAEAFRRQREHPQPPEPPQAEAS